MTLQEQNVQNLENFAAMLEPVATILGDKELLTELGSGKVFKAVPIAVKKYPTEIIEILAASSGVPASEYKVPAPPIMILKALSLFNRPDFQELFTSQVQMSAVPSFGSAMENTEDGAI